MAKWQISFGASAICYVVRIKETNTADHSSIDRSSPFRLHPCADKGESPRGVQNTERQIGKRDSGAATRGVSVQASRVSTTARFSFCNRLMSSMRCFFCENIPDKGTVNLSEREKRHLFSSLRHSSGDKLFILDGCGGVATAEIRGKEIFVISKETRERPKHSIHLFFCPPHNKNKTDIILAQATELGVASINPVTAKNSVSKPDSTPARWKVHLVEAIKQSFNPFLPEIGRVMSLQDAIRRVRENNFLSYFGTVKSENRSIVLPANFADIAWFVGPEGGFTDSEENFMLENGFIPLKLAQNVLRIETASCAGLAVLLSFVSLKR